MFKINCACGKANKNFKYDIGPMYVDECCKAAGYDDLGKRKSSGDQQLPRVTMECRPEESKAPTILQVPTQPSVPSQQSELSKVDQPSVMDKVLAFAGVNAGKLSKNKLSRLRVEELKILAKSRGLPVTDDMTRIPLTELLLK